MMNTEMNTEQKYWKMDTEKEYWKMNTETGMMKPDDWILIRKLIAVTPATL